MPRKGKGLPAPCPICRWSSGTVQFKVFSGLGGKIVVFSIKHYDPSAIRTVRRPFGRVELKEGGQVRHAFRSYWEVDKVLALAPIKNRRGRKPYRYLYSGMSLKLFNLIKIQGWKPNFSFSSRYPQGLKTRKDQRGSRAPQRGEFIPEGWYDEMTEEDRNAKRSEWVAKIEKEAKRLEKKTLGTEKIA